MHPIGFGLFTFADATLTPHGDGNNSTFTVRRRRLDATLTPHGDGNKRERKCGSRDKEMQLLPLTGTVTLRYRPPDLKPPDDATLTPHGDGNAKKFPCRFTRIKRMQLLPLTGTVTDFLQFVPSKRQRCNSYPSRGR